jgi:site-specific DNA recombinase
VRAPAGVSLVQRQARLPVPPRPYPRHRPEPGRPRNTYVREDQILPHLAAVAILLGGDQVPSGDTMQVTSPDGAAALIGQLRTAGITLTYDPDTRTIRTGDSGIAAVTIGQDR